MPRSNFFCLWNVKTNGQNVFLLSWEEAHAINKSFRKNETPFSFSIWVVIILANFREILTGSEKKILSR